MNFPGVDFLGTASKCTKRKKHSSFCVKVPQETSREKISRLGRAGMARKIYQKACCTCKIVIFLINKPIAPLTFLFPSPSPSALLKLPYIVSRSLSFFPLSNIGIVHNLSEHCLLKCLLDVSVFSNRNEVISWETAEGKENVYYHPDLLVSVLFWATPRN